MTARTPTRTATVALVALGLAFAATPVAAQQSGQGQQEQIKTDWSGEKLEAFAAASVAINEAQGDWQTRIREAETQEKRRELRKKANQAATQAIEDQGLTVGEYNRIYQAAQKDPELHDDLLQRVEDERAD